MIHLENFHAAVRRQIRTGSWLEQRAVLADFGLEFEPPDPPWRRTFQSWLLDESPFSLSESRFPLLRVSACWQRWGGSDDCTLRIDLHTTEATIASLEAPELGSWLKSFKALDDFTGDAVCLGLLGRWVLELDPEKLVGADDDRLFVVYGFDWQGQESLFSVGTADGAGWSCP